jgi:hypothetical protein
MVQLLTRHLYRCCLEYVCVRCLNHSFRSRRHAVKASVIGILVWFPLCIDCGGRVGDFDAGHADSLSNTSSGGAAQGDAGQQPADATPRCAQWTNAEDCNRAGCRSISVWSKNHDQPDTARFIECQERTGCTAAFTCAHPPGQPGDCYLFTDGCIPTNWVETASCLLPLCPREESTPDAS